MIVVDTISDDHSLSLSLIKNQETLYAKEELCLKEKQKRL